MEPRPSGSGWTWVPKVTREADSRPARKRWDRQPGEGDRMCKGADRLYPDHDRLIVIGVRVGLRTAGGLHDADDGLFVAGMVEEDLIARSDGPQVLACQGVRDAVPEG